VLSRIDDASKPCYHKNIGPPRCLRHQDGSPLIYLTTTWGKKRRIVRQNCLSAIGGLSVALGETAAPPNASVYIISPKDGDTVTNPLKVQFGLSGMGVAPAGVDKPNTGHHHLLIDVNEPLDPNEPIPQDKNHLHFGAGQTEALIELPPGEHTLQLVLGDWSHLPFHPLIMSAVIRVIVK
jgi:hypothetical protein